MKLHTSHGEYKVSIIEQGDSSCLLWYTGESWKEGEGMGFMPLPEDVAFALISLGGISFGSSEDQS